jgi:hypothetical protein
MAEPMRSPMSSEHDSLVVEIRDLFRQLDRVVSRADRFGWDHPATVSVLASAEAAFIESLEPNPRTLRVEVRGDAFTVDELDVWVPASPLKGVAKSLFSAGIVAVEILPGIRAGEIRAWLRAMMADRAGKLAPDDDLRTALWDAAIEHVRFEIADDIDPELVKRTSARAPHPREPLDRVLRAETLHELVRETASPTAARLIDALTSELANPSPEAHARLRSRVRDAAAGLIERGELARLLEIHDAARDRSTDPDEQRALVAKSIEAAIFEGDSFPAVLEVLRGSPRDVRRFGRILERIDASRIGDVLAVLRVGADGELRTILEKFVERAARGHEAEVARAIVDSPRDVAVRLLAALARVKTSAAAAEISRLAQHGDEDVRLDAKLLGASDPVRAVEDVVQMIDAPDAPTRFAALRAIGRHDLQGAVFTLVRRLRAQSFADLPLDEKAELLRALLRLSPEQGEAISLEILRTGGMFQSDAREATRLVAVELLGELGVSNAALEALREVSKTHWGASRTMRDAAENAARALDDRISKSESRSQPPPSELRELPIGSSGRLGARIVLPQLDHRATYALMLLEELTRTQEVTPSPTIKRAAQTLAELSDADLAATANLLISSGAQRHEMRFAALVGVITTGILHHLGASMDVAAETAFASLECEEARVLAKSNGTDVVLSIPSFGRLDEPASRRVILAAESLEDPPDATISIRAQILATSRRFVRALGSRSSASMDDVGAVIAQMSELAESSREKLIVQLVARVLDPPLTATARGTLAVTPFVHLLAYMLDHASSGSVEITPPNGDRHVVIFRKGVPVFVHPRPEALSFEIALAELGRLSADSKYVFYKDIEIVDVVGDLPILIGDLYIALAAARAWPDRLRMERMLSRIAHRRLVLHPRARIEGLNRTPVDRSVIAALQRGARLPELRVAHPDALGDVDTLIYVLAVMRQLSLPGLRGEPIGSR